MKKTSNSIRLLLTRHGETEENVAETICGQLPGILTEKGIQQAKLIGKWLNKDKPLFHCIYVSDLQRTKDTFQCILSQAKYLSETPTLLSELIRQKCGGVLHGKPRKIWKLEAEKANVPLRQFKCQNSQSFKDVKARAFKFLKLLVEDHILDKNNKNIAQTKRIFAVSHGGFIRQFQSVIKQINEGQKDFFDTEVAQNCSINEFMIEHPTQLDQFDQRQVNISCINKNWTPHP